MKSTIRLFFLMLVVALLPAPELVFAQDQIVLAQAGAARKKPRSEPTPTPTPPPAPAPDPGPLVKALVVYDAPPDDPYSKLGKAYAIMLRNLLGHFNTQVELVPVERYAAGQLEGYDATFYLGAYYDNPVAPAFLADVAQTARTVVWFKHNLWQLAWDPQYDFANRFGMNFAGLRGMSATPSAENPTPGFFDTVLYKGKAMEKYYAFDAATGTINADPELGEIAIVDPSKAQSLVPVRNSVTQEELPYIVRSGNFWYVADMPFSFIGPRDRYLVICDILYDMLGVTPATTQHRALVRLEDVSALTSLAHMRTLTNEMQGRGIPFSIATIPFYRDPMGKYNDGVAMNVPLSGAHDLRSALDYALARGGKVVMHGYTHQYGDEKSNPHTGVSGDDYEFWLMPENRPVPEDSEDWARGRLQAGLAELDQHGYTPFAWEAPHYHSSPKSMKPVPQLFHTTYQRVVYYTSDTPTTLNTNLPGKDFAAGQFYPYIIKSDYYGQRVLPENLGNIEYDISHIDPTSFFDYTAQDLCTNADYARVVRGAFASFFFHPFWLESSLGTPGLADFRKVLDCVTALGYTWVDPSTAQ